jgi:DNA replication protein DnaC
VLASSLTFAKSNYAEALSNIQKLYDETSQLMSQINQEYASETLSTMSSLRQGQYSNLATEERRSRVSSWINAVDARNVYETLLRYHQEGTCEWVLELEAMKQWKTSSDKGKLLWIHGPPGFGKTIMSSWIIRDLMV